MGLNSKIEWTDHSWNPWFGCDKVSAGCDNCYAERMSNRFAGSTGQLGIWGKDGVRRPAADSAWELPLQWNRRAEKNGVRERVFPHLCDPFEHRSELVPLLVRLFSTIRQTSNLDWLLLTKRPELVLWRLHACNDFLGFVDPHNDDAYLTREWIRLWLSGTPPANVWLGVSVENQDEANNRIPELLNTDAVVRFLSCEPLLGPINLNWVYAEMFGVGIEALNGRKWTSLEEFVDGVPKIDWVICGGESGPKARPMDPAWARDIRRQCVAAGVPFFFKQWGEWIPGKFDSRKGEMICYPGAEEEKLIGEIFWTNPGHPPVHIWGPIDHYWDAASARLGKSKTGRLLDGRQWNEFPERKGVAA